MALNLKIGSDYRVELYPSNEILRAEYLGECEGTHFFLNSGFVLIENNWAITKENGVFSYNPNSSAIIDCVSLEEIPRDELPKLEKVLKALKPMKSPGWRN